MKTLTVRIETLREMGARGLRAVNSGRPATSAGLSFPTYDLMYRVLSPKRLAIIRAMAGQGVLSYREIARRVERDYKGVHTDLTALVLAGVVDRAEGGLVFPYENIHFDFNVTASAA
ncbi:MAG: transcriptional regulator [Alphaproteobacteria bacterium]|nr:transcriptional regulator [Alphaproteobacteria bacterium]